MTALRPGERTTTSVLLCMTRAASAAFNLCVLPLSTTQRHGSPLLNAWKLGTACCRRMT